MFSRPALNGTDKPRAPPVIEVKCIARASATSVKAMVAMAKNGPFNLNTGQEIRHAIAALSTAAGSSDIQGET